MKKNWMAVSLLAGSLAFGVSSGVGKAFAEDQAAAAPSPSPTAAPAPSEPVLHGFVQVWAASNTKGTVNFLVKHARVKVADSVDPEDTLVIMPDYGLTGFTLLDAYELHRFKDVEGLSLMAGQFKFAFGDDRYLLPTQLKRTDYAAMDAFAFPGTAWDIGMEAKEQSGPWDFQADLIQGAGQDVTTDNDNTKDLSFRGEWKSEYLVVGVSDYYGTSNKTGFTNPQDWFGAHLRILFSNFDLRGETILAPNSRNAYLAQASYKAASWLEPVVWYETGAVKSATAYNNLGAGVNLWGGTKTRISFDLSFVGISDILSQDTWTLQAEQVF